MIRLQIRFITSDSFVDDKTARMDQLHVITTVTTRVVLLQYIVTESIVTARNRQ